MPEQKSLVERLKEYNQELSEVKAKVTAETPNWWRIYPMMVRLNANAPDLGLNKPFANKNMKYAKEQLCRANTVPPSPMP